MLSKRVIWLPAELTHKNTPFISYRGADKSLARPTSRCILFDGEKISFDASLVLYININIYIYIYIVLIFLQLLL
jgi:hypothetical protein